MTSPMLEKLIRFQRTENALPFARNLDAQTLADIFGTQESEYRSVLDDLDRRRAQAAARIAASPTVDANLRALPFAQNAHLVAIGESTTADRLSWFEILRTLFKTYRPDLQLHMTNLAVSGATTGQALSMLPALRRMAPDWVFCMLGTNDSQRFDSCDGPLLVSPAETTRNLTELRTRAVPNDDVRWVWLTPTTVDEDRIARFPFFAGSGISWSNDDLMQLTPMLPTGDDLVIDSPTAIPADDPDALADDGLHPNPAAHEALAAQVFRSLVEEGR